MERTVGFDCQRERKDLRLTKSNHDERFDFFSLENEMESIWSIDWHWRDEPLGNHAFDQTFKSHRQQFDANELKLLSHLDGLTFHFYAMKSRSILTLISWWRNKPLLVSFVWEKKNRLSHRWKIFSSMKSRDLSAILPILIKRLFIKHSCHYSSLTDRTDLDSCK